MPIMKASARNMALTQVAEHPRVDTAVRLLVALVLWGTCGAATAGNVVAANIHAAAQTLPATKRVRPAHSLDLSGPRVLPLTATHAQRPRLSAEPALRTQSAGEIRIASESAASAAGPISIHWQSKPEIVRAARQFRHNGLPIVRLWQSGPNLLAIGLNPHGVPGIYFTQKVPD
jgi:hypothetical protein